MRLSEMNVFFLAIKSTESASMLSLCIDILRLPAIASRGVPVRTEEQLCVEHIYIYIY